MKRIIISILVASGLLTQLMGQDEAHDIVKGPVLCQGNYQTEQQAIEQLARMAANYGNLKEWNARAARVRKQISDYVVTLALQRITTQLEGKLNSSLQQQIIDRNISKLAE